MTVFIETQRLLLRELEHRDAAAMFDMDADPEVHRYLGNSPVQHIDEIHAVIDFIRQQYQDNGIGRWAVEEKGSGLFLGWTGLKYHREPLHGYQNIYELGYRFQQRHWGKGYATEASLACIAYGFQSLEQNILYAMADSANAASRHVLEKCGFQYTDTFLYEDTIPHDWFELRKS